MSINTRLSHVTQALSPLQRAVLVLQAERDGREPDPDLRRIGDVQQARAFNRYMTLLWVANHQLGAYLGVTAARVDALESAVYHHNLLNEAAGLLEEQEGAGPAKASRNWRRKDVVRVPEFLRGLALEVRDSGRESLLQLWQELRALDVVWDDLAAEFAGEDPALPQYREQAADLEGRLREAAGALGLRRLPEAPNEALLQQYRESVNQSFQHLGLGEPYA